MTIVQEYIDVQKCDMNSGGMPGDSSPHQDVERTGVPMGQKEEDVISKMEPVARKEEVNILA